MKQICLSIVVIAALCACNSQSSSTGGAAADSTASTKTDSTDPSKDWKLGVQLWTFSKFDFVTAISKVDSAGVKYIEAYSHQPLGGGMKGDFGPDMTPEAKTAVKALLASKGITLIAMGVIVPKDLAEWKKYFDFGRNSG